MLWPCAGAEDARPWLCANATAVTATLPSITAETATVPMIRIASPSLDDGSGPRVRASSRRAVAASSVAWGGGRRIGRRAYFTVEPLPIFRRHRGIPYEVLA